VPDAPAAASFPAERLLESERVAAIVVIVAVPTKWAVTGFLVERDGTGIMFVNFKPDSPAPATLRVSFRRRQKAPSYALPSEFRVDCYRIDPCDCVT
jgi:hypothetical protein